MATRPKAVIESHDGEKFSPITIAKNVLTDDGQNLHDILSDRKEDMMTPTIENSSSMFKVGQGDNVDFSDNVMNGAYEDVVLKGKTMVNCIQEPSSQDVVLPYEFTDGQYVTINDTKESGALGVELKGQTLVNVHGKKAYGLSQSGETIEANKFTNIVKGENQLSFDMVDGLTYGWGSFVSGGSLNLDMLKPNTKYLVYFATVIFPEYFGVSFRNGDGTNLISTQAQINKGGNYAIITTTNEIVKSSQILYISIPQQHAGHYGFKDAMIIEYQQGMETWDIPYFEGMASCKMPILKTVGKNLLDPTMVKNEWYPFKLKKGTTLTLSTKDSVPSEGGNICFKDGNNQDVWFSIDTSTTKRTMTLNTDVYQISNMLQGNIEYQMEYGSTATTFEPYKTSILSLPEEVVLRSLPNSVCDTFNTRTGVYTQRTKTLAINGTESWREMTLVCTEESKLYEISNGLVGAGATGNTGRITMISDKYVVHTGDRLWNDPSLRGVAQNGNRFRIRVSSNDFPTVDSLTQFLQVNPITVQYELETPIVTKINLPSTLKSWNTTTHIYSEIPENSLYPTLTHSNPTYPVILKPSTKYSIVANSYSNGHTNSAINFNLGGATASTTVGNRVTTITTPSTLSNELLTMSGRGNKLNNVMVIEGDVVGDEPYFEGMCDSKSPILSNVMKNLVNVDNYVNYPNENLPIVKDGEHSYIIENKKVGNWQNRVVDKVKLKANTTYTLSYDYELLSASVPMNHGVVINLRDDSDTSTNISGDASAGKPRTFTPTRDTLARLCMYATDTSGGMNRIKFSNIQLEESSNRTEYEPYKSNTTTFDQKDGKTIVLRSLPNGVCDTLDVRTGEYVQNIGEVVLDGSENWVLSFVSQEGRTPFAEMILNGANSNKMPICDKLIVNNIYSANTNLGCSIELDSSTNLKNLLRIRTQEIVNGQTLEEFKQWLSQNPVTIQYELATPIVKQVNVEGYPYAYENGHILLESGSQEQSLTPTIEYSIVANRGGQIRSNQRMVERHQKQLDRLQAMVLANLVNTQYEQTLTNLKYDLKNVREEVK